MKISMNDIIKEEVQKFTAERPRTVTGDDLRFTQYVPKIFFYNYSILSTEYDADIQLSKIILTWQITFSVDSRGIINMTIDKENCKVEGPYSVDLYDQHTDQLVRRENKNIEEEQWNIIPDDEVMIISGKPLRVKDLEFDFANKVCKITFINNEPRTQSQ